MDILFSRSWIFKGIPMCVILELLPPDDVCWQTQSSRKRSVSFSFNRLAGISCNGSFLSTLWHGEGYNGSSARSAANGWFCQWAGEVFLTSIPSTSHSPCYAATHGHIFHHIGWNTWSCNNSHILPVVACAGGGFFPSKWFFFAYPTRGVFRTMLQGLVLQGRSHGGSPGDCLSPLDKPDDHDVLSSLNLYLPLFFFVGGSFPLVLFCNFFPCRSLSFLFFAGDQSHHPEIFLKLVSKQSRGKGELQRLHNSAEMILDQKEADFRRSICALVFEIFLMYF